MAYETGSVWVRWDLARERWYVLLDWNRERDSEWILKAEAVNRGRHVAGIYKTELLICNKSGTIIDKDTGKGGNDPYPPRG